MILNIVNLVTEKGATFDIEIYYSWVSTLIGKRSL